MSTKRITVGLEDSSGNNLTNRDSLEVTFSSTAYPLTSSNATNCSVSPTSISANTNVFTATFPNDNEGAYSFTLTNSAPNIPDAAFSESSGNPSSLTQTATQFRTNTSWSEYFSGEDAVYANSSSFTIDGHQLPYGSNSYTTYMTSSSKTYGVDSLGRFYATCSAVFPSFATSQSKTVINLVLATDTFSATQGDYFEFNHSQGVISHGRIYTLNVTTGEWTLVANDGQTPGSSPIPTTGTYRAVILAGCTGFASQTSFSSTSRFGDIIGYDSNNNQYASLSVSGTVGPSPAELIETSAIQEIGDSLVHLFELTLPAPYSITLYFHNGLNGTKNIYFPDKSGNTLNEYIAFPIDIENLETRAGGGSNRPTLAMANIPVLGRSLANDSDGTNDETNIEQILSDQGMGTSQDFLYSTVVYRSTLLKYTKEATDTPMLPIEYPSHTFTLDRVSNEMSQIIQFELATPADLDRITIPARRVVGKYCSWEYQGALYDRGGCTAPKNSFGMFFDVDDKLITANITGSNAPATWTTTDTYSAGDKVKRQLDGQWKIYEALRSVPANKEPKDNPYYWTRIDVCGKRLKSCKLRFHGIQADMSTDESSLIGTVPDGTYLETSRSLPFGGFPGMKKST